MVFFPVSWGRPVPVRRFPACWFPFVITFTCVLTVPCQYLKIRHSYYTVNQVLFTGFLFWLIFASRELSPIQELCLILNTTCMIIYNYSKIITSSCKFMNLQVHVTKVKMVWYLKTLMRKFIIYSNLWQILFIFQQDISSPPKILPIKVLSSAGTSNALVKSWFFIL